MKRIIGAGIATASVLVTGYAFASPYLAINSIRSSVEKGDAKRLSKNIDFEAVRSDLKDQLKTAFMQHMTREMADNPFAGIGMLMVAPMVDSIVDSTVSPSGLAALFSEGRLSDPESLQASEPEQYRSENNQSPDVTMGYTSLNQFEVKVAQANEPDQYVLFTMEREGLSRWMVNGIKLSPATFEN